MRRRASFAFGSGLLVALVASMALVTVSASARADETLPPWVDPGDVPLPEGAKSVSPIRASTAIAAAPGHADRHRGTTVPGVRLPLFAATRAPGCAGRWLEVGPLAWICSDAAEISRDDAFIPPAHRRDDGLPYRYFAVGRDGAEAFLNLDAVNNDRRAESTSPDETLDSGFVVAVVEERRARGETWGRTVHGRWIALRELVPVHASSFAGVALKGGALDFAWVLNDSAFVYAAPAAQGKPKEKRVRFDRVPWHEQRVAPNGGGVMVRVSADGATPEQWMRAKDLAHPTLAAPPDEVGGASATDSWVDVDVESQTLVAYEGAQPTFATLVSTGKGASGTETTTPLGVHRVVAKRSTSDMDDIDADNDSETDSDRSSLEDVPYVQLFERGVAFVGAFWHRDFGRPHSRGNVELAPKDAEWLFGFTSPRALPGWTSVEPTPLDRGTIVRVRDGANRAP